ncbi:MAG TPA: hypothetical protein HPQ03_05455 [Deltaproteobacteria bacterium]|nr:hypothetical protein [Deltaproteobacteria bacterium]
MIKTMTTIILTIIGVLFGMQNFDHVPVYIFWGKAINIRLIFVIAIAGVGGYLIRHFVGMAREDALRRRLQATKMNSASKKNALKKRAYETDDEDF